MRIHNVIQGSADWHALRADPRVCTASEAPAMMGESKYKTRTDLLRESRPASARRSTAERRLDSMPDTAQRRRSGPMRDALVGDELYPVTGTEDIDGMTFLASFDGLTMAGDILFEHKLWSADLASMIGRGELRAELDLAARAPTARLRRRSRPIRHQRRNHRSVQAHVVHVHTRAACGADRRLAAIPRGSRRLRPRGTGARRGRLPDHGSAGRQREYRGALQVLSNLPEFGGRLRAFIDGLNPAPESDQDFADAENEVKVLKRAEDELPGRRGPCPRANLGRR